MRVPLVFSFAWQTVWAERLKLTPVRLCSFYYADERQPDGANVGKRIDGDAHADFYYGLATGAVQAPWLATFVKGEGYVDFSTR